VVSTPKKPPQVVSYRAARIGGAIVTGFVFFMILWMLGAAMVFSLGNDPVLRTHGRWVATIAYGMVPLFAAHSAGVGFPDAFAQGRFVLPEFGLPPPAAGARATNPWLVALVALAVVGLPLAAGAYWLTPRVWPASLSAPAFVTRFAGLGAVFAGAVFFVLTGQRFLREAALPHERRRFAGSLDAYVWQRHVWPQALINVWINVWVTFALIKGPLVLASSGLSREAIVADALGTGLVLAFAVGGGTIPYARFDLRWGVAPAHDEQAPSGVRQLAFLVGMPLLAAALTLAVLTALRVEHVSVWPLTIVRSLLCGAYAGLIAHRTAHWALSPKR
jgi:hypothetical protein